MSSYTDLIGRAKIENDPPGGISTVQWWLDEAGITAEDRVLDLACSTGFSSRNIAGLTGAKSVGIDISAPSIETAIEFVEESGLSDRCSFELGNAEKLSFENESFSVVVVGSVFGFISDKQAALRECSRVLLPGGRLCVGSFYFRSIPETSLLDEVEQQIGFRPNPERSYEHWKSFFTQGFTLQKEKLFGLPVLDEEPLQLDVQKKLEHLPDDMRQPGSPEFETLYSTRRNLNLLRRHQGITLWILTNDARP